MKKLKLLLVILVPLLVFIPSPVVLKAETLQEKLDALNAQIREIQSQKNQLQSQISSNTFRIDGYNSQLTKLYGEAKIFDSQIKELELQIQIIETQMQETQDDIDSLKADIKKNEDTEKYLEEQSESRIKDSYVNFRIYGETTSSSKVLNMKNINTYFKTSQYKEFIQSDTNKILSQLADIKNDLAQKHDELNNKLTQIKKDKEAVEVKQTDLKKQKEDKDNKIAQYLVSANSLRALNNNNQLKIFAFSQDENVKRAEANKIQQEILNNYVPTKPGQYVVEGTIIGSKGCTGLCTGAHLHFMVYRNGVMQNPCGYLPAGTVGGCGVGNPTLHSWPLRGAISLTSGYGNRCFWWGNSNYCDFHTGIDLVSSPWNAPVYTPMNGYINKGVDPYGANYIIVCENPKCTGIKLGFWHLSRF